MFEGPISILAECAALDTSIKTEDIVNESAIRTTYSAIPEVCEEVIYKPEMVPVLQIGNDYMVEANCLQPFMTSAGITSMSAALDMVSEANHLPHKSVGLLIESECAISDMIQQAAESAQRTGKKSTKKNALNKVKKVEDLVKGLTDKGYKVKKKKSTKSK